MTFDEFFKKAEELDLRLDLNPEPPLKANRFVGGPWHGKSQPVTGTDVPMAIRVPPAEENGMAGLYWLSIKLSVVYGSEDHPVYQWKPAMPDNLPKKEDLDL